MLGNNPSVGFIDDIVKYHFTIRFSVWLTRPVSSTCNAGFHAWLDVVGIIVEVQQQTSCSSIIFSTIRKASCISRDR